MSMKSTVKFFFWKAVFVVMVATWIVYCVFCHPSSQPNGTIIITIASLAFLIFGFIIGRIDNKWERDFLKEIGL